jgi:hypothetical protein
VNGAILRPSWRSRIPARREGVLEANGVFSRLIGEGSGLSGTADRDPSHRWSGRRLADAGPLPGLGTPPI